jgi:hypothetical protein
LSHNYSLKILWILSGNAILPNVSKKTLPAPSSGLVYYKSADKKAIFKSVCCPIVYCMKKQFVVGVIGGLLGIATAAYVIFSSVSSDMTLSGVQAALFSSLGLMGAAIANTETRFAGWMLLSSAVWILLSVPLAGTFNLLIWYLPAVIFLGIAAMLCFREPEADDALPEETTC